jgi:hypothetical protein
MKKYIKPEIEEEILKIEDIICASSEIDVANIWHDGDNDFIKS